MGKAPVRSTGGSGYNFEDQCAAYLAVDLLGGRQFLGTDVGAINRIDFQAQESDWLFDDLVLTFTKLASERSFAMSYYSDD